MGLLIASIIVASATSASVYLTSASLMLAFFAYAAAGTITLLTATVVYGFVDSDEIG